MKTERLAMAGGLCREAWAVICVQQRHHPHAKLQAAHRGQDNLSAVQLNLRNPDEIQNYHLQSDAIRCDVN